MKIKNNGFTLVELLLTIAIIGVLSVVTGLSITGMLKRQEEGKYEDYIEDLENAACVYAQKNDSCDGGCEITVPDLIAAGLMKNNVQNPKLQVNITEDPGKLVISYVDGERICEYSYEEP